MSRRSGLGRGLQALIPQGSLSAVGAELLQLPLSQLRPNRLQPRKQFDEEALASLVDSIKVVGVLQPVLVRELAPGDYELIAGERRFRAAHRAGLASIPAVIRAVDDVSSLEQALVENLQREDLNVLEEAAAYQQLIEEFDLTHEDVARRVGKSRAAVTNALRLFQLPPTVQRYVRDGVLSAGHARALLGSPDRGLQERTASQAIQEGFSVRAVEDIIRAAVRAYEAQAEAEGTGVAPAGSEGTDEALPTTNGAVLTGRTSSTPSGGAGHLAGPGLMPASPTQGSAAEGALSLLGASSHQDVDDDPDPLDGHSRLRPPGVVDLEQLLGDYLNTRVSVDMGGKHGRVVVEFATLDDLERIYRLITGQANSQEP